MECVSECLELSSLFSNPWQVEESGKGTGGKREHWKKTEGTMQKQPAGVCVTGVSRPRSTWRATSLEEKSGTSTERRVYVSVTLQTGAVRARVLLNIRPHRYEFMTH